MKKVERDYTMSNSNLAMLASNFVSYMNRDSAELAVRGVTATDISDFQALGDSFEVFPTDDDYIGLISIAVNAKNATRATMFDQIQLISGFFEQEWGITSGQYRRLGIKGVNKMGDSKFLMRSREVVRIANEYFSVLSNIGMIQSDIDSLETNAQTFEDQLNAVSDAKAVRETKSRERQLLGNQLYSEVKKYSTIGKLVWENVDETKYNDYIIYKSISSNLGKVLNLAYDDELERATWSLVSEATIYELQFKLAVVGADWQTAYEGANNFFDFPPPASTFSLRARAKNSEFTGPFSNTLDVIIVPTN